MYKNLAGFIDRLEHEGELVRICTAVTPELEIAELTDRESKRPGGGRALLFEQTGTSFPVVTNMMGSERRMAMALGVERLDELTGRIGELFGMVGYAGGSFWEKLRILPVLERMSRWLPRERGGRGACQEVVLRESEIGLSDLPILKCWPHDGGRFITLPLVHTVDPENGIRNVGMYRMQVFGERETGMHWHLHKTGERHYRAYKKMGKRMPVSVCLGGDPVYTYAATAPMPDKMDEYLLAGFLRKKPVELVKCMTNDLRVPADCDFVMEGYVDPAEPKRAEGPFGDHTGFYSLEDDYPIFHVTALTHRRRAIYPATVVGIPPQEDFYLARATEKIFLGPIRAVMLPEIEDLWMPAAGVMHNLVLATIRTQYPGQGMKTASLLWGAGQMMLNKFLVVMPAGAGVRDISVLSALVRRARLPENVIRSQGPLDVLDHAAPASGLGGKLALDLTGADASSPEPEMVFPDTFTLSHGIAWADTSLALRWSVLAVGCGPDTAAADLYGWLTGNGVHGIRFAVMLDSAADPARTQDLIWLTGNHCDPGRDITIRDGVMVLDARTKAGGVNGFTRRWPNPALSDALTIEKVDARWDEYGLGEFTLSPSLPYQRLSTGLDAEYVPDPKC